MAACDPERTPQARDAFFPGIVDLTGTEAKFKSNYLKSASLPVRCSTGRDDAIPHHCGHGRHGAPFRTTLPRTTTCPTNGHLPAYETQP